MPRKKSGEFDQYKYINNFSKENYRRVTILVPKSDTDMLEHLDNQPSKSAYILDLIKKDMETTK